MPLFILYGPDRYSMDAETKRLLDTYLPLEQGGRDFNLLRLDGQRVSAEQLAQAVQAMPFLGERRVIVIDGLLTRFGKGGKSQVEAISDMSNEAEESIEDEPAASQLAPPAKGKRSKAAAASASAVDVIGRLLNEAPDSAVIITRDAVMPVKEKGKLGWKLNLPRNNPLTKYLKGEQIPCLAPQGLALARWVEDEARSQGAQIDKSAVDLLTADLSPEDDRSQLVQELGKLATYAGEGGRIDAATVRLLTPASVQEDVFRMVNAMAERDSKTALAMLEQMFASGRHPFELLGTIAWQFRNLLQVKELDRKRMRPAEIAARVGMSPFVAQKSAEQSRAFSIEQLKDIHHRLLTFDAAAKRSLVTPELGLELLVADICR